MIDVAHDRPRETDRLRFTQDLAAEAEQFRRPAFADAARAADRFDEIGVRDEPPEILLVQLGAAQCFDDAT